MKEMIYSDVMKREWLDHGELNGCEYVIMNLGTHPTAYVGIPKAEANALFREEDLRESDLIEVHGGITYENIFILDENIKEYRNNKWWIGWDYAHVCDYMPGSDFRQNQKKWTTEEIFEDVKSVIEQIVQLRRKENE